MIPRVPKTGRSFLGAWNYYAHDKRTAEQKAKGEAVMSTSRVAWTHTENLAGLDADRLAVHLMKETAAQNRHCQQPVYAFSLAWHPEQTPSQDQMIEAGRAALKVLGMEDHQALFIAHQDTDHSHVHIMVNRVHPETLKAKNNFRDFKRLSEWAMSYEREHGKIYCAVREANALAVEQDSAKDKAQRYADHVILQAWQSSDSGRGFQAALEAKGWQLALGDHKDRFMTVAPSGKPLDILREINKTREKGDKLKLADLEKRFADLKRETLPFVIDVREAQERQRKAAQAAEREDRKRTEDFKRHAENEAMKAFRAARYGVAEEERQRIERLHRELRERHIEQQRIHQNAAAKQREDAAQAIKDTYRLEETTQTLKAIQQRQNEKGGFWSKISGKHEREQKAIQQEIKDLRRTIADGERRAAEYRQHVDNLIRQNADALALRQKQERDALPPIPPTREQSREKEQSLPIGRERSRDRGLEF